MIRMIVCTALFFIPGCIFAAATPSATLVFNGSNFLIYITNNCTEWDVDCQDVDYHAINKKTRAELKLKGETWNKPGTGDFVGYKFKNGDYLYTISNINQFITRSTPEECYGLLQLDVYHNDRLVSHDEETCQTRKP